MVQSIYSGCSVSTTDDHGKIARTKEIDAPYIVNLPSFIAHTNMDTESVNLLRDHLAEFMK
jgi:hypothetical protein